MMHPRGHAGQGHTLQAHHGHMGTLPYLNRHAGAANFRAVPHAVLHSSSFGAHPAAHNGLAALGTSASAPSLPSSRPMQRSLCPSPTAAGPCRFVAAQEATGPTQQKPDSRGGKKEQVVKALYAALQSISKEEATKLGGLLADVDSLAEGSFEGLDLNIPADIQVSVIEGWVKHTKEAQLAGTAKVSTSAAVRASEAWQQYLRRLKSASVEVVHFGGSEYVMVNLGADSSNNSSVLPPAAPLPGSSSSQASPAATSLAAAAPPAKPEPPQEPGSQQVQSSQQAQAVEAGVAQQSAGNPGLSSVLGQATSLNTSSAAAQPVVDYVDRLQQQRKFMPPGIMPPGIMPRGIMPPGRTRYLRRRQYLTVLKKILDILDSRRYTKFLVQGEAGIGLSMFLQDVLLQLLAADIVIIWQHFSSPNEALRFSPNGEVLEGTLKVFQSDLANPGTWLLSDTVAPDMLHINATILCVTSSKNESVTKHFKKEAVPIWMEEWDEDEICVCAPDHGVPEHRARALFKLWGGIPRHVLQHGLNDYYQDDLRQRVMNKSSEHRLQSWQQVLT